MESLNLAKAKNGRLEVGSEMQVKGTSDIWALGDCAFVSTPDGVVAPPTAQHAIRQATVAAQNIVAAIRGGERRQFTFKGLGRMGSLGHQSAVAEIFGLKVSGFTAWLLWRTVYLMKLPGWTRRLKVAWSWTLDLLLPPELVQLRLGGTKAITREHFEPGQNVFQQGELGDRLFIILSGEAEVVREDGGRETVLARLGPGQFFGEMALVHQTTRNATVRCAKTLDVLSLPKQEFAVLAAHLPDLRRSFETMAEERTRMADAERARTGGAAAAR
jgi:NADH dehydrogenase